jgi:hypothetical protein
MIGGNMVIPESDNHNRWRQLLSYLLAVLAMIVPMLTIVTSPARAGDHGVAGPAPCIGDGMSTLGSQGAVCYGVQDPGFEDHFGTTIQSPWATEGPDPKGLDENRGLARTGLNNAWIRTSSNHVWNAITQVVNVMPHTDYQLVAWVRTSGNFDTHGYFGVRSGKDGHIIKETRYGHAAANPATYQRLQVPVFNSGLDTTLKVYIGFWSVGVDAWEQIDDVQLQYPYYNWAGYVAASDPRNTAPFTYVSASWVQPPGFPCTSDNPAPGISMWVGLGGVEGSSLVQIGTEATCHLTNNNNKTRNYSWFEVIDGSGQTQETPIPSVPVSAGDTMVAAVMRQGDKHHYYLYIRNQTKGLGKALPFIAAPHSIDDTAEVVVESPCCGATKWPTKVSVHFKDVYFDDNLLDDSPDVTPFTSSDGGLLIFTPTPVTNLAQDGFSVVTSLSPAAYQNLIWQNRLPISFPISSLSMNR